MAISKNKKLFKEERIAFSIDGLPVSVNRMHRAGVNQYGTPFVRKTARASDFEELACYSIKRPEKPLSGKIEVVYLRFTFSDKRKFTMSDLDNLQKNLFDSLKVAGVIKDDRYIFRHKEVEKILGTEDKTEGELRTYE